jgi:hypothetical protein
MEKKLRVKMMIDSDASAKRLFREKQPDLRKEQDFSDRNVLSYVFQDKEKRAISLAKRNE